MDVLIDKNPAVIFDKAGTVIESVSENGEDRQVTYYRHNDRRRLLLTMYRDMSLRRIQKGAVLDATVSDEWGKMGVVDAADQGMRHLRVHVNKVYRAEGNAPDPEQTLSELASSAPRPGSAGRKPIHAERMKRYSVVLTEKQHELVKELGDGNVSRGIRALIDAMAAQ